MPDQRARRFLVEIYFNDKWQKEVYTDWFKEAVVIGARYIGIHKTRIVDTRFNTVMWEVE